MSRRQGLVKAACSACRRRKLKCTGERPTCGRCQSRGDECGYVTETTNETRSEALQRRHVHNEANLASFEELFDVLQKSHISTAESILAGIRLGVDRGELISRLKAADPMPRIHLAFDMRHEYDFPISRSFPATLQDANNVYSTSLLYETLPSRLGDGRIYPEDTFWSSVVLPKYRIPYHAAKLIDPAIDRVTARPWTSVTSDNHLVQDLLRTYFVHEYAYIPIFHKDVFLEDMVANGNEFCSPLLVNAILALAWHGRSRSESRSDFWDPTGLGHRFLIEAMDHWRRQESRTTVTTVQATLIIWIITNIDGQDDFAWPWMTHTIAIARDLELFTSTAGEQSERQRVVRCITAWSIFAWQAQVCFHFHRPPLLEDLPLFPLPTADEAGLYFGELCIAYPHIQMPVAMSHASTFRAHVELRIIMNRMAKDWYGTDTVPVPRIRDPFRKALMYRTSLQEWYSSLPIELSSRKIVFPSAIKAHMHYWTLMIYLFEPFKNATLQDIYFNPAKVEDAQRILTCSYTNLEMLVRLYYKHHGCTAWDSAIIMFIFVVAANALRKASGTNTEQDACKIALHTLVLCAKCLADQSGNTFLAEATFRGLRNSMRYWQTRILGGLVKVKDDEHREMLITRHLHSKWPVQVANVRGNPTHEHLGTLFYSIEGYEPSSRASA